MLFHTHIYYARLLDTELKDDPYLIIGAMLPDFALMKLITWQDLHTRETESGEFTKFISDTFPVLLNLTKGIQRHNELDFATHTAYKGHTGFAFFYQTPELVSLVKKACGIDDEQARLKAHNFLESGVEMLILKKQPTLGTVLKEAIKQIDNTTLATCLSEFFQLNVTETTAKLEEFLKNATSFDLTSMDGMLVLWEYLTMKFFNKSLEKKAAKAAIQLALQIVEPEYSEFITSTAASAST